MSGHTPGLWEAIKGAEKSDEMRCAVMAMRGKLGYLVATIENGAPGDCCDTEWENAKLMAAGPVMLLALETIEELLAEEIKARRLKDPDEIHSLLSLPLGVARAAIAKATP